MTKASDDLQASAKRQEVVIDMLAVSQQSPGQTADIGRRGAAGVRPP